MRENQPLVRHSVIPSSRRHRPCAGGATTESYNAATQHHSASAFRRDAAECRIRIREFWTRCSWQSWLRRREVGGGQERPKLGTTVIRHSDFIRHLTFVIRH